MKKRLLVIWLVVCLLLVISVFGNLDFLNEFIVFPDDGSDYQSVDNQNYVYDYNDNLIKHSFKTRGDVKFIEDWNFDYNKTLCESVPRLVVKAGPYYSKSNIYNKSDPDYLKTNFFWHGNFATNNCCQWLDKGTFNRRQEDGNKDTFLCYNSYDLIEETQWLLADSYDEKILTIETDTIKNDFVSSVDQWYKCDDNLLLQTLDKTDLTDDVDKEQADQFLCFKRDYNQYEFLRCCGKDKAKCNKIHNADKTLGVGDTNYLVSNFPSDGLEIDVEHSAETHPRDIYDDNASEYEFLNKNWAETSALEIFFTVQNNWDFEIELYGVDSSEPVFKDKLVDYVVNGPGYNKIMRAVIPVNWRYMKNFKIVFETEHEDATPPNDFDNKITFLRMVLKPTDPNQVRYCSDAFYVGGVVDTWISDLDDSSSLFGADPVGKAPCNAQGFNWTGTKCCGDDLGDDDTYTDIEAGCWKGEIIPENQSMMDVGYDVDYNSNLEEKEPVKRNVSLVLTWYERPRADTFNTLIEHNNDEDTPWWKNGVCPQNYNTNGCDYFIGRRQCERQADALQHSLCVFASECRDQGSYLDLKWNFDGSHRYSLHVKLDVGTPCYKPRVPKIKRFAVEVDSLEPIKKIPLGDLVGNWIEGDIKISENDVQVHAYFEDTGNRTTMDYNTNVVVDFSQDFNWTVLTTNTPEATWGNRKLNEYTYWLDCTNNGCTNQNPAYSGTPSYYVGGLPCHSSGKYVVYTALCRGKPFALTGQKCNDVDQTDNACNHVFRSDGMDFICRMPSGSDFSDPTLRINYNFFRWYCGDDFKVGKEKAKTEETFFGQNPLNIAGATYRISTDNDLVDVYFQGGSKTTTDPNANMAAKLKTPTYTDVFGGGKSETFSHICLNNSCDIPLPGRNIYTFISTLDTTYSLFFVNNSNGEELINSSNNQFNKLGRLRAQTPLQVLFFNESFWGCDLSDHMKRPGLVTPTTNACEVRGDSFCGGAGGWTKGGSGGFTAEERDSPKQTVTGANVSDSNYLPESCCPADACWNGTGCVGNMADEVIRPQFNHSCIDGDWIYTPVSYTWDKDESGYCPTIGDCLVEEGGNGSLNYNTSIWYLFPPNELNKKPRCIGDGQYVADNLCTNFTWESRTKKLAIDLLDLVNTSGNVDDYTLFCDNFSNVFAGADLTNVLKHFIGPLMNGTQQQSPENPPLPYYRNMSVTIVNNFCSLDFIDGSTPKRVYVTSFNIPIDESVSSFLWAMRPGDFNANTYCNSAKGQTGFNKCGPGNSDDMVWYSEDLNALAFSTSSVDLSGQTTFFESVLGFFKTLINWIIGQPISDAEFRRDYDFVTNTSRLQFFYNAVRPSNKSIIATMEVLNQSRIILGKYENLPPGEVCGFIESARSNVGGIQADVRLRAADCNETGNTTRVFVDDTIIQPSIWLGLTAGYTLS